MSSGSGSGSNTGVGEGEVAGGVCGGFGELEPEAAGSFGLKEGLMRCSRRTCEYWFYLAETPFGMFTVVVLG